MTPAHRNYFECNTETNSPFTCSLDLHLGPFLAWFMGRSLFARYLCKINFHRCSSLEPSHEYLHQSYWSKNSSISDWHLGRRIPRFVLRVPQYLHNIILDATFEMTFQIIWKHFFFTFTMRSCWSILPLSRRDQFPICIHPVRIRSFHHENFRVRNWSDCSPVRPAHLHLEASIGIGCASCHPRDSIL